MINTGHVVRCVAIRTILFYWDSHGYKASIISVTSLRSGNELILCCVQNKLSFIVPFTMAITHLLRRLFISLHTSSFAHRSICPLCKVAHFTTPKIAPQNNRMIFNWWLDFVTEVRSIGVESMSANSGCFAGRNRCIVLNYGALFTAHICSQVSMEGCRLDLNDHIAF